MLPILEFIFASGWRFAGTVALIIAIAVPLSMVGPLISFKIRKE